MKKAEKMVIYQVFPRWFGNRNTNRIENGTLTENGVGKFSDFTPTALSRIKDMGITHIWYTGVIEHATNTDYSKYGIRPDHGEVVKGNAGSPYAIKDYYDVDPDLADSVPQRMKEFEELVVRTHEAGLKMIMDFVPNHVARQYHSDVKESYLLDLGEKDNTSKAFDPNNNFYYIPGQPLHLDLIFNDADFRYSEFPAKVTGNDCFGAMPGKNDWYETIKLNYGVDYLNGHTKHFDPIPDTWNKMLDILLFWAGKGIDGFRCDMAEMVPVEFWHWVIPRVKEKYDVCFIAEVYNPDSYRSYIRDGHFDYLYDKVGLYDTLRSVICNRSSARNITGCWQSLEGIQHNMLNFLENHDEQRLASEFFAGNPLPGIPGMMVAALMNVNPVMIYSGQELGESGMDKEGFSGRDGRTTIFDYWSLPSLQQWSNDGKYDGGGLSASQQSLRALYSRILTIAKSEPTVVNGSFYDLSYANNDNPYFNSDRQYVFLRKWQEQLLLVVVNFDKQEQKVGIRIPDAVFQALSVEDNSAAKVTDLMNGRVSIGTLTSAWPYQVSIPAFGGCILKFDYSF